MKTRITLLGAALAATGTLAQDTKPATPKQPPNPIIVPHLTKFPPKPDFNKPVHGKWELVQFLKPHAQIDPLPRGVLELKEDGTFIFTDVDNSVTEGKYKLHNNSLELTRTTLFGDKYTVRYYGLDYINGMITRKISVNAYEVWMPYKEKKKDDPKTDDKPKPMPQSLAPIPGSIPPGIAIGIEDYLPMMAPQENNGYCLRNLAPAVSDLHQTAGALRRTFQIIPADRPRSTVKLSPRDSVSLVC